MAIGKTQLSDRCLGAGPDNWYEGQGISWVRTLDLVTCELVQVTGHNILGAVQEWEA